MKMATGVFAVGLVFLALILVLVFFNRGSEKVMSAFVASIVLIITAICTVVIFVAPQTDRKTASVAMFYHTTDLRLMQPIAGWREMPGNLLSARFRDQVAASLREDGGLERRAYLLQQLLQASILQWIAINIAGVGPQSMARVQFPFGMRGTVTNLSVTAHDSANVTLSPNDIIAATEDNLFLSDGMQNSRLTLPRKTQLYVYGPHVEKNTRMGRIAFSNPAIKLNIYTQEIFPFGPTSLASDKRVGIPAEQAENYTSAGFLLTTEIEYVKWRAGDPAMPELREWATAVAGGVVENFDENAVWKQYLDRHSK